MARRVTFAAATWLFLLGIVVQVFLAGAGLFKLIDFTAHGYLGWLLPLGAFVLPILAFIARVDRATGLISVALLVLTFIQPELAAARHTDPVIASFHPVNALLIFWLAWTLVRRSTTLARTGFRQVAAATD